MTYSCLSMILCACPRQDYSIFCRSEPSTSTLTRGFSACFLGISTEPEHLCTSPALAFKVLIHPSLYLHDGCCGPNTPVTMALCYLGTNKAISKPIQAGLAVGEIAQIHILQLVLETFSQEQRQVVMAGDVVVSVSAWPPGQDRSFSMGLVSPDLTRPHCLTNMDPLSPPSPPPPPSPHQ